MLLWLTACFARGGQYHLAREHADKFEYGQQVARLSMASRLLTEMANESSRQAQPADLIACYQEAFETIDKASHAAHHAYEHDLSLRQACLDLGYVNEVEFDRIVDPAKMVHPGL